MWLATAVGLYSRQAEDRRTSSNAKSDTDTMSDIKGRLQESRANRQTEKH